MVGLILIALGFLVGHSVAQQVCVGDVAECAATSAHDDETSLLMLRGEGKDWVQCPGSKKRCSGNQCCPGAKKSKGPWGCSGDSFPCPNSDRDFKGCSGGRKELTKALLSALTRDEKYKFTRGVGWKNGTYDQLPGYYIGNTGDDLPYGIPNLNMMDNGQGFRTVTKAIIKQVTGWPCTLSVASTWSETDSYRWAAAIGKEFIRKGANVILGPGVNYARNALGGRVGEYVTGESAYFGKRMVQPYVRGIQSNPVLAVMKHFAFNQQENDRDSVDIIVDDRTKWEVYYPPFEGGIEAGALSFMCSYNLVNGEHACGSKALLNTDLRKMMGYKGFVMSDWWAEHDFVAPEVDQEMPGDSPNVDKSFYNTDKNLGTLSDTELNRMVAPQLEAMLKYGLFEKKNRVCQPTNGGCNHSLYEAKATDPKMQELNKELATNAVMLLKNERKTLPLTKEVRTIALLGSACDAPQPVDEMLKTWDMGSYYNIGGSGRVIAYNPVSILKGFEKRAKKNGVKVIAYTQDNWTEAVKAASGADVAFICGGTTSTEGKDRTNLEIDQQSFIVKVAEELKKTHQTVVTLTLTPGAILMPWANNADAIVNLFLAGTYTGTAIANVVFGDANPFAKTILTFPLHMSQTIPPCVPESTADEVLSYSCPYSEGLMVGWHGLIGEEVQFPFGHGLSYTEFKYNVHDLITKGCRNFFGWGSMPKTCTGAKVCAAVTVVNVGKVAGRHIPQLYLGFPEKANEPKRLLRGFKLTALLEPGHEEKVYFPLFEQDLQTYEEGKGWTSVNGKYDVWIGASSRDDRINDKFGVCNGQPNTKVKC